MSGRQLEAKSLISTSMKPGAKKTMTSERSEIGADIRVQTASHSVPGIALRLYNAGPNFCESAHPLQ
jgi:hypothetical protein